MVDESQQDSPRPDSEEVISEDDLNALLSEASELAAEIASDVGEPDPTKLAELALEACEPPVEVVAQASASAPSSHAIDEGLELKMADVDTLLCETHREIGEASSEEIPFADNDALTVSAVSGSSGPDDAVEEEAPRSEVAGDEPPLPPSPVADPALLESELDEPENGSEWASPPATMRAELWDPVDSVDSVPGTEDNGVDADKVEEPPGESPTDRQHFATPDFMDDLTRPEESGSADSTPPSVDDGLPDFEDPASMSENPLEDELSGVLDNRTGETGNSTIAASFPKPAINRSRWAPLHKLARSLRSAASRFSPAALQLADRGIRVLELLNRPMRRLGTGPRELVGWLAIATLATSMLVFVISLF